MILLSNWTLYKLDTTASCMDHTAWTMLHSSTPDKAYLTGISHRRAEQSDWWHLIKVPMRFRSWSRFGDQLRDCVGALAMCHQTPLCSLYTYHIGTSLYHQDRIFDASPMVYFIISLRVIPDSLIYPWLDLFVPDQMAPLGRCFPRISRAAAFDHSHQFCISSSLNSLLTVYMY